MANFCDFLKMTSRTFLTWIQFFFFNFLICFPLTFWHILSTLKIIEYLKLELTRKDHLQLLNPHWTTQNSEHITELIVQMLLEPWQLQYCNNCSGESVPVPCHSLMKNIFLISNQTFPCCSFMKLLQVLSLVTREREICACPTILLKRKM